MIDYKSEIKEFLLDIIEEQEEIDSDELFSSGVLNSLDLVTLIGFLEEKYNIKVESSEVVHANFDSIDKMTEFLKSK